MRRLAERARIPRSLAAVRSICHPPPVHEQVDPADEAGIVGGQEGDRGGHIARLAEPYEWRAGPHVCRRLLVTHEIARGAREDLSRGDGVADDAVPTVLHRDLTSHLHEAPLADGIGEMAGRTDHPVLRGDIDDPTPRVAPERLPQHLAH